MISKALREHYRGVWPAFAALPTDQGLSLPLFVSPHDTFEVAPLRLLVVGQETYSWYGLIGQDLGEDPVGRVLDCYRQFNLGMGYRSPFWDAVRKLQTLLGPAEESIGLAWSNVYPCDQRKDRPAETLGRSLLDLRVLPGEVRILQPQAVVFFTGPEYDGAIGHLFPMASFADSGAPPGQWVHRVVHPELPTASYRTYHPAYLRRKRKEAVIDTLAGLIRRSLTGVGD